MIEDLTSACIKCGFCLESCPTFLLTGDETQSPRGRISLAQGAQTTGWTPDAVEAIDSCLGCRACETACPSGVKYGDILELARSQTRAQVPAMRLRLVQSLSNSNVARLQFGLGSILLGGKLPGFISRLVAKGEPTARVPVLPSARPWPEFDETNLPAIVGEVAILRGCVMPVLYPDVQEATVRLLRRVGYRVVDLDLGCCGALLAHSGYLPEAEAAAQKLGAKIPQGIPLIVNSAGCGSTLKAYGHVVGMGLEAVAAATKDATEFLLAAGLETHLHSAPGIGSTRVAYHEACHLIHGQRISEAPRRLISAVRGVEMVSLVEADMCCGSAGTYNIFQPGKGKQLLDRKWQNVVDCKPSIVAMGNPGCHSWIQQAATDANSPVRIMHTLDLLESAFTGLRAL